MNAIFIDRDGVVNKDPGGWTEHSYVTEWKDFRFIPSSFEALKILKDNGIKVIVISNQAGVNKGFFTRHKLDEINKRMVVEIKKHGGDIEDVYCCVHRSDENCRCRKPNTLMLEAAARKHDIDTNGTFFVGDSLVDVQAGKKMGISTVFVLSGKTTEEEMRQWKDKPDYIFPNLLQAVKWIVEKNRRKAHRAVKRQMKKEER
jgi:histidinol-phosphate phosphatase family protein